MVGEQGPELVNLPAGSYVNRASNSQGGRGATVIINYNPTLTTNTAADVLALTPILTQVIRGELRNQGIQMTGAFWDDPNFTYGNSARLYDAIPPSNSGTTSFF